MLKEVNNTIIFLLCLMLIGFFANFAQNDYGMELIIFCCGLVSLSFYIKTFYQIISKKIFNAIFAFSFLCGIYIVFFVNGMEGASRISFGHNNFFVFITAYIIFIFAPSIIIPLLIVIKERKFKEKTISSNYFTSLFSAMFCLGIYMKEYKLAGASIVLILSGFIILPMLISFFKSMYSYIKAKNAIFLLLGFSKLFIGSTFVAFIFKTQHWPGSNLLLVCTFGLLGLNFILIMVNYYLKSNMNQLWTEQTFTTKTLFLCYTVTTVYVNLMRNDILPKVYSNNKPKALQELIIGSNDFTVEGRTTKKKAQLYADQYENFLFIQWHNE